MSGNEQFGRGNKGQDPVSSDQGRPVPKSPNQSIKAGPGVKPPRRTRARAARSQIVVFFNFLFSLIILGILLAGGAFYYGKSEFEGAGPLKSAVTFDVNNGWSISQIATALEREKVISDGQIFKWGVRAYGNEEAMKSGEYEIKAGASMRDIMNTLVSGQAILHSLTIVEGMTVQQAMKRIEANEILVGDMPEKMPPEGSLIADTQRFGRQTTRADIIDRMMTQQKKLVEQIWAKRAPDLPVKTIEEFVALASIVEKETGLAEERPRVAAVFENRLRQGMRLQSDPTIIYGIFGGEGKPADRPIYQSDLDKVTPYNTYQIDGIPPGPIAIPGRASLEAVANPARTQDLYFVADGSGGHVFAKTLEEHNANVAKWREIEKQREADRKEAEKKAAEENTAEPAPAGTNAQ